MEKPITFINNNGKKLFGIVHIPDAPLFRERKIGINLLNPGIKYRVAPNRLNVKFARKLCEEGYFVFRFDPEGIGDSEGELPEGFPVPDIWGKIQTGLFVNDTLAANNFFRENYKIDALIFIGNCGGAITALLVAELDLNINGLCLIDIPVYLWDSKSSYSDAISGGELTDRLFYEYFKKLFDARSWYNLVTLRADFHTAWKVIKLKTRDQLFPQKPHISRKSIKELCLDHKLNPLFFKSIENIITRGKPVLFISSENDPGRETFQKYFLDYYLYGEIIYEELDHKIEISKIEKANHVYSTTESQNTLFNRIFTWLSNLAFK